MPSVLLLGFGAIGRHVARLLSPELEAGAFNLTALVSDRAKHDGRPNHGAEVVDLSGLARLAGRADIDTSPSPRMFDGFDVIVECAGVPAAAQLGPPSSRPVALSCSPVSEPWPVPTPARVCSADPATCM